MSLVKKSITGSIIGLISFLITIGQSIVIVPYLLSHWSKETYGIWIACYLFINLLRTLDAGHQIYVGNEFAVLINKDILNAKILLGSSIRIALSIGLTELIIYCIIVYFKFDEIAIGISPSVDIHLGLLLMVLMWFCVGSIGGILVRIIIPLGYFNRSAKWGIFVKLVEILLLVLAINLHWSIGELLCYWAVSAFIYSIIIILDVKSISKDYYPWWQAGTFSFGFYNFRKSLAITANNFLEQFAINGHIFLISNVLGVGKIAQFTTIRTATNVLNQGNQIIINPILPDIVRFHVNDEKQKITDIIHFNWLLLNIVFTLPILLFAPYVEPLYKLWTNNQLDYSYLLTFGLLLAVFTNSLGRLFFNYLSSLNNIKAIVFCNVARVLILFPGAYISLKISNNINGLGLIILIAEVVCGLGLPYIFAKNMGLRANILVPVYSILVMFAYTSFTYYFNLNNFLFLFISILLLVILIYWQWKVLPQYLKAKLKTKVKF